jgi:tetratricopeptide (TPR) repeat protein
MLAVAPAERVQTLRAAGSPAVSLAALAAHVEKLAMTQVSRALQAGALLVEVADALAESLWRARVRRAYAQALAYAGRFREALPVFEQAIDVAAAGNHKVEAAECQLASIHALVHLARYDAAIAAGEAARAAFLEANEPLRAGRAESSLGGIHQKRDDPATALQHFERAGRLLRDDAVARAQMESNRGLALESLDDFPGAERAFQESLAIFESARMGWACAIVEGNLAVLATRQGRLQQALRFFERARRHLELDAAPAELARTLVEQADALAVLRLFEMAESDYRTALPLLEEHGQVREAVQARAGLGRVLALTGRHDQAAAQLIEAAREYDRLGQPAERARLDLIRAEMQLSLGRLTQAHELAVGALKVFAGRPLDATLARYHLARSAWKNRDLETAVRELNTAVRAAEYLGVTPLVADLLHVRGLVHRDANRPAAAVADLSRAVEHVERVRGSLQAERFRAAFHGNRLAIYEDLVVTAADRDEVGLNALTFATVERAKSRALMDQLYGTLESVDVRCPEGVDQAEAALIAELNQLRAQLNVAYSRLAEVQSRSGAPEAYAAIRARIQSIERQLDSLESRLATTRGVAGLHARPAELSTVQAALRDDAALVEYFTAGDEILALVVTRGGCRTYRRLARTAELHDRLQRWGFQLGRALRPGARSAGRTARLVADARRELEALHHSLFAPLRDAVGRSRRLLIVPHGDLHALPFHALWDGNQYLIESHELSHGPSANVLMSMGAALESPAAGRALVVGVADERAPGTEDEALRISETLQAETVLLGNEATAARFRAEAPRAAIIHLACHGFFSRQHPRASGIRLADRWLSMPEIYDLGLRARMVTLAGCETGRNVIGCGDELLGLLRGFVAAGARALIASLWIVHDEVSGQLMTTFYNELRRVRDGAGIAASLRAAQLRVMATEPHPAHWAPFIFVGGL